VATLTAEQAMGIYRRAATIRTCDERFRSMIKTGQIRVVYYPPWGQEVLTASVGTALQPDDYMITTYRGVHDQISKGVTLAAIWAEFLGRATGTCKGKGGPMHITDVEHGLIVTTGIVGAGLPIANGLGLSSQLAGDGRVTVVNFGDGATNIGAFHEAMNLASLWKLPVVFVCQNNGYAEHTSLTEGTSVAVIADRATSYSMPGVVVDGNDATAMFTAATEAIERARRGDGPTLLDAKTYRFGGHAMNDQMKYMPADEFAAALAADPVPRLRVWVIASGHATEADVAALDEEIRTELDTAVTAALAAPEPDASELFTDVYAEVLV
jgi:acetoin:2,6-dichlorophenolindophenol oxidoreductase subunit alpha